MNAFPVYYDFRVAPLSFDFAVFLAISVGHAKRYGFEKIDVTLVRPYFRRSSSIESTYANEYDEWKFRNVILALLSLTPAVNNVTIVKSGGVNILNPRYPQEYTPSTVDLKSGVSQIPTNFTHLIPLYDRLHSPTIFRANNTARSWIEKRYGNFDVCLTLRTAIQKPGRNIDLSDWYELYRQIARRGLKAVVIPDHDDLMGDRRFLAYDWISIDEAGADLGLRQAAYSVAKWNISWACGMYTLLFFSDTRYLIFGKWDESEPTSSSAFLMRKGPTLGTQFPWSKEGEHVIDWTERGTLTRDLLIQRSLSYLGVSS